MKARQTKDVHCTLYKAKAQSKPAQNIHIILLFHRRIIQLCPEGVKLSYFYIKTFQHNGCAVKPQTLQTRSKASLGLEE